MPKKNLPSVSRMKNYCTAKKNQHKEHNMHKITKTLNLGVNITQHKDISQNCTILNKTYFEHKFIKKLNNETTKQEKKIKNEGLRTKVI